MRDRKRIYLEIWSRIRTSRLDGFMVSERGLQAALYAELFAEFRERLQSDVHIVVEPAWEVDGKPRIPDLVLVEEDQITDIFELKFKPDGDPPFEEDIRKLLQYGVKEKEYPVELNRLTDQVKMMYDYPVGNACRLHFVAVANRKAAAVRPSSLRSVVGALKEENPELKKNPRELNHWFGPFPYEPDKISDPKGYEEWQWQEWSSEWSIEFGIR